MSCSRRVGSLRRAGMVRPDPVRGLILGINPYLAGWRRPINGSFSGLSGRLCKVRLRRLRLCAYADLPLAAPDGKPSRAVGLAGTLLFVSFLLLVDRSVCGRIRRLERSVGSLSFLLHFGGNRIVRLPAGIRAQRPKPLAPLESRFLRHSVSACDPRRGRGQSLFVVLGDPFLPGAGAARHGLRGMGSWPVVRARTAPSAGS